jgi:ATP-dependent exoDNAse (exonuclease V) alpha subunit
MDCRHGDLPLSVKVISRSSGRSAVAAAAYRGAERLHDERLDRDHDFTNKDGVVHSEVLLPEGAPEEFADREKLWNAVEAAEKRKDAQLAREVEFAIPRELTKEQGIELAREFAEGRVRRKGHDRRPQCPLGYWRGRQPKPHAHVMLTMREVVGKDGFGAKVRDWNKAELVEQWRERWADHVNERLAELDIDARIDHRSLEAQGIALEPQDKIGPAASRMGGAGLRPSGSRNTAPSRSAMASGSSPIPRRAGRDHAQQATFTPRLGDVRAPAQRRKRAVRCRR